MQGEVLPLTLNIGLHCGTLLAVLMFFWRDWRSYFIGFFQNSRSKEKGFENRALLLFAVGTLPAGIVGLLWKDSIERLLHHPLVTIPPLMAVGFILVIADRISVENKKIDQLNYSDILWFGIFQAFALIPGVSRSGATITAGRLLGYQRTDAAKISFLLGCPAMLGAALLELRHATLATFDSFFIVATLTAFMTGFFVIKFFLEFLKKFGFSVFAIYRMIIAIVLTYLLLTTP